jgi:hypothetical protein
MKLAVLRIEEEDDDEDGATKEECFQKKDLNWEPR